MDLLIKQINIVNDWLKNNDEILSVMIYGDTVSMLVKEPLFDFVKKGKTTVTIDDPTRKYLEESFETDGVKIITYREREEE